MDPVELRPAERAIITVAAIAMIGIVVWIVVGAESKAQQLVGVWAGVAIGASIFVWRACKFAAQIGIWPFVRNAALIAGSFVALITAYTFRYEFTSIAGRVMGELTPLEARVGADGAVSVVAAEDGHYHLRAAVNGVDITFMIDTGASDIVLAPDDARRIGIDPANLEFDQSAETANGTVRGAAIRLQSLSVGSIQMGNLPAAVNGADMSESLLGMEFLNRLHGWRVENGVLTLVP
jgi:aspartyl protease family protein